MHIIGIALFMAGCIHEKSLVILVQGKLEVHRIHLVHKSLIVRKLFQTGCAYFLQKLQRIVVIFAKQ